MRLCHLTHYSVTCLQEVLHPALVIEAQVCTGYRRLIKKMSKTAERSVRGTTTLEVGQGSDAAERPGMATYRNRRVQAGVCARTPASAHAGPHLEARRTDSGGLTAVVHLSSKTVPAPFSRRVPQYSCGPRERRVQGGERRGVRAVQGGTHG